MTTALYAEDAYLQSCEATVLSVDDAGIVLDRTVFYPRGGGQPGDSGRLELAGGETIEIADTVRSKDSEILHLGACDAPPPKIGMAVVARLDWPRRHAHMRMHTGLHLLGTILRHGVTGGSIGAQRSRLDFDAGHRRQGSRDRGAEPAGE